MSGHGRTSWYSEDAAWQRRELIVELGDEFGSDGPMVMKVLRCWTQEQVRDAPDPIRGGFRSLAREAFTDADRAKAIVERAAAIGALDDLVLEEDGRRFVCRVSGWAADQHRGAAAFRKQAQRQREADVPAESDGVVTPERDMSQDEGAMRDVSPLPDLTNTDQGTTGDAPAGAPSPLIPKVTYRGKRVDADTVLSAVRLLRVFNAETSRGLGFTTADGNASPALKQVVGALRTRPDVEEEAWADAIRRTVAAPPSWVEGQLQLGHIFGERAAEHALASNGARREAEERLAAKYQGTSR